MNANSHREPYRPAVYTLPEKEERKLTLRDCLSPGMVYILMGNGCDSPYLIEEKK